MIMDGLDALSVASLTGGGVVDDQQFSISFDTFKPPLVVGAHLDDIGDHRLTPDGSVRGAEDHEEASLSRGSLSDRVRNSSGVPSEAGSSGPPSLAAAVAAVAAAHAANVSGEEGGDDTLNTPVSTSGDVNSFFGGEASMPCVEPVPITGKRDASLKYFYLDGHVVT